MDIPERQDLLNIVDDSLRHAESKHPAFASMISRRNIIPGHEESFRAELKKELEKIRWGNDAREAAKHESIEDLLKEEILEALDAFYNGDYILAKQEFSQVAAVAIRAMRWVDEFSTGHRIKQSYRRKSDVK